MLRKVSSVKDAKKLLDEIWQMKSFANEIQMELIRREYNDDEQDLERKRPDQRNP